VRALIPLTARCLLAVCLLATAAPAFAQEEEFSVAWLEKREVEMTAALARAVELESSRSAAIRVVRLLDAPRVAHSSASAAALAAVPAAPAPDAVQPHDAAPAPPSRMRCGAGVDRAFACVVHPSY